jgi:protein-disulfide isomerase
MMAVRALGFSVLLSAACSSAAQPAAPAPQTDSSVVATIDGTPITLGELDRRALRLEAADYSGLTLSQAMYEARRATLDDIIASRLIEAEARRLGLDGAALAQREIVAKIQAPTEADIAAWYNDNQERVNQEPLEKVREPIRQLLLRERSYNAQKRYVDTLKAKSRITLSLDPPREQVADAGRPSRGPADAPVQIIEFSDFQCPFCQRSLPTIEQVMKTYGDRVRLVYRHFPLPNHAEAWRAAEASMCAADQDKFWPYHDRLFANQDRLGIDGLKQHAIEVGLDTAAFNACVDGRKYQSAVQEDMQVGQQLGVTGTPAFYINGRPLSGAQPFEAFKEIIDEELKK